MRVYLSGLLSNGKSEIIAGAVQKFREAENIVRDKGHEPVNPIDLHSECTHERNWDGYMVCDLGHLLKCEAIYMIPGWCHSKGARIEIAVARELGLTIIYGAY